MFADPGYRSLLSSRIHVDADSPISPYRVRGNEPALGWPVILYAEPHRLLFTRSPVHAVAHNRTRRLSYAHIRRFTHPPNRRGPETPIRSFASSLNGQSAELPISKLLVRTSPRRVAAATPRPSNARQSAQGNLNVATVCLSYDQQTKIDRTGTTRAAATIAPRAKRLMVYH